MAKKMALVPSELVSEYYQLNKPEFRLEENIHDLLLRDEIPNDLRAKLLSHLIPKYQKIMQPPPPDKRAEIPPELLSALEAPEVVDESADGQAEKETKTNVNIHILEKYLAHAVPKAKKKYVSPIIERLQRNNYTFNERGELEANGKPEYRSHAVDLFSFLMRDLKQNDIPPKGFDTFFKGICESNIPQSWVGNKTVREQMQLSETDPLLKERTQTYEGLIKTPPKKHSLAKWIPWSN